MSVDSQEHGKESSMEYRLKDFIQAQFDQQRSNTSRKKKTYKFQYKGNEIQADFNDGIGFRTQTFFPSKCAPKRLNLDVSFLWKH